MVVKQFRISSHIIVWFYCRWRGITKILRNWKM